MNIKSLAAESLIPNPKTDKTQRLKTEGSFADKDADGRRDPGSEEHENLSEDEFEEVLKLIQEHQGVVKNGLKVELESIESTGQKMAVIKDGYGKVVKRIPEVQLRTFLKEKERKTGHLLNTAA